MYPDQEASDHEILVKLKGFGIKEFLGKEILQKHDEDYILANIRVVEEELESGKKIRNIPAYLMRAFEVDFRPVETEFDKIKKQKSELKAIALQAVEEEEQKKQELELDFERDKNSRIEGILASLEKDKEATLKEIFLASVKENPIFKKFLETKGFEHGTIQTQRRKFIAEQFLPKSAYDFQEYLKAGR